MKLRKQRNLDQCSAIVNIIPDHVQIGKLFHRCLLIRDPISYEIIFDVGMVILIPSWLSSILLELDGALIILIDNIIMDILSLFFQKVVGPDHLCQYIVHSDKLGLSWTLSVKFLFLDRT